ncbi:hypothetical protein [Nannocystis pusilla]|uniref:hypothetical protein n=1 Tax=Nannocystis pusilla TaxID=889268 RepID=UPI003BEF8ABD
MNRFVAPCLVVAASCLGACASGEDPSTGFGSMPATATMTSPSTMTSPTEVSTSAPTTGGPGDDMGSGATEPPMPECGDGKVEGDEECDAGGDNDDGGACTAGCRLAVCGDGLVQTGVEACDDGNPDDDDDCTSACEAAGCGDGIVGPGEACDDGNKSKAPLAKHPRSTAPSLPGPIRCLAGVHVPRPSPTEPDLSWQRSVQERS